MDRERRYLYYDPQDKDDLPDSFPKGFVFMAGRFINVHQLALAKGLDYTYLYRVFRGERVPSLDYAKHIAAALEMETFAFLQALQTALSELSSENT